MKITLAKKWGETITRYPIRFILLSVFISLGLGLGAKNLTMSNDYRYFFGEDNPFRIAFENIQNTYSSDDSLLFVIKPKDGVVFKQSTLAALRDLTEKSWKLPFSTRVDSITNFQYSFAQEDDLIVKDLVDEEEFNSGLTPNRLNELKNIAVKEPLLESRLINKEASVTGINVRMNFPGKSPFEVPETAAAGRKLIAQFKQLHPDHEVYITGLVMLNNAFNEAGMKDMTTLTPLMYLVIIVIMYLMLRTVTGVLATFTVLFFSIISGMGFAGWAGIPITPPSSIAPIIIMTLAVADSVHILKSILNYFRAGMDKKEAIVEGLRVNFRPVFLTSFTTAIGFISLNFSDTPPFHDLGNMTAVGVTMAFFLSVVLLPAALMVLPMKAPKIKEKKEGTIAKGYSQFISNNLTSIGLMTLFATIFLALQIPKIKLNDQFVEYFDESIQFRTDSEFTMDNLTGFYSINYNLKSEGPQGINSPEYLKKMEEFSNFLRTIPGVVHVNSLTDTIKRLNRNMHGEDPSYYKIPDNRELAAQYLLLYEMSLPYGLDLNNQIDIDKASSRVIATMGNLETAEILAINEKAENWLKENAPAHMQTLGSSPVIMFSHISQRNVISMAWATLIAFILITLVMIVALGSFKYGVISLLPNVIPAFLGFGLWSLFVGEAGFSIAIVGSVTLGIVVDDTVHFLSKYALGRSENNFTARESVEYALQSTGSALIVTSVVLVLGFGVLMMSTFKMNFILGALSALTIAIALLVDFTFLPALLNVVDKKKINIGGVMKKETIASIALTSMLAFGLGSVAQAKDMTPEQKGLWVAKEADKRDAGFINQVATTKMILRNKAGKESSRLMRIKTLEMKNDGDKSLTIFDTPKDVKGTAFLSFTHAATPDDQWLYMPALKRVKRISSSNKSGPFMGSEFAYEDLSSQEVEKYTYKYLRSEKVLGVEGHVVERYPVDKKSGYTKQVAWIDGKEWRPAKIDYYDRKGALLKSLSYIDYKKYPNNKWRPSKMEMVNHQNGKSTTLIWEKIEFNQDISSRDFDKNALKRIR